MLREERGAPEQPQTGGSMWGDDVALQSLCTLHRGEGKKQKEQYCRSSDCALCELPYACCYSALENGASNSRGCAMPR